MTRPKRFLLLLVALLMVAGVACGGDKTDDATDTGADTDDDAMEAVQPETITAVATDKAITFPAELESEPVVIELDNKSKAGPRSIFAFAQINEGFSQEDLIKSLATKTDKDDFEVITVAGALAPPGATTILFPEGDYAAVMPDESGIKPAFFTVVAASGAPVTEPEASSTIETGDFFFKTEGDFAAGDTSVLITNTGEQSHMVALTQGRTEGAFLLGPAPGGKLWTTLTVEKAGKWEMLCFFSDTKTGKPHFKLGMSLPLKVSK